MMIFKTKKAESGTGYEIQYKINGTSKYKSVSTKSINSNSISIKKLKSGKQYQFRIRVYTKVGKKVLTSKWSKVKTTRTK